MDSQHEASLRSILPLHYLIRYASTFKDNDTIEEHLYMCKQKGCVWWGKFGVGISKAFVTRTKTQIQSKIPSYAILGSGTKIKYIADIIDIHGGGNNGKYYAPDQLLVPYYYREERCSVWYKLQNIKPIDESIIQNIRLYSSPTRPPKLNGMRGIIYITLDNGKI